MGIAEILLISISLGMDACAVAICKGLSMKKMNWKKACIIGLYFGIFQALMPIIGYALGCHFGEIIRNVEHWIALILLSAIGINMIKEAMQEENENNNDNIDFKTMIILAIATSIDALAVGITFAFLKVEIISSAILIGIVAFVLSVLGVKIGNVFGDKYGKKAEMAGGIILILIGIKIVLEHLQIINF